jgi:hypothetical protein
MPGFANGPSGNSIIWSDNVDFSGAVIPTETVSINGQLLIGSTSTPNIKVGSITSPNSSVTVGYSSPNITLVAGASVPLTFTEDSGSAVAAANNLNILGQQAGTIAVMGTIGAASTVQVENRSWLTPLVVDPSATVGLRGTFATIASALTAASSGQTIFIRPGTYTENITLKSGVNLTAWDTDSFTPTVSVVGLATLAASGTVNISGIQFTNNGSNNIFNGVGTSTVMNFTKCKVTQTDGSANTFVVSGSSTTAVFTFYDCNFAYGTNSGNLIRNLGGASFTFRNCNVTGTGTGTKFNCNTSGDSLTLWNCDIQGIVTLSSNGTNNIINTKIDGSANNAVAVTGACNAIGSYFLSGTNNAFTSSAGTANILNTTIDSTNTTPLTTSGTLNYSGLVFSNTGITVSNAAGTVNTLPGQIVTITGSLTNAQIKALHGTPVSVIPAPGSGKVIQVVSASAKMVYGGTNVFTAGAAQTINLYYGTATSIAAVLTNAEIVASATQFNGVNALATFGGANTGFDNTVVNLYNPIATEITGNAANNNTVTYQITYQVVAI